LFANPEDRARELMLGEKKSSNEASEIMKEEGYTYTPRQLGRIKKNAFEDLIDEQKQEVMSDFLLESVKKNIWKFEDIFDKFEKVYDQFEKEGKSFEQIIVLKELKSMLNMSIKKLGGYKSDLENIKVQNINIISNTDVMQAIKDNQEKMFISMSPEVREGKLILNSPTPEVLDAFYKWQFTNGKSKGV